MVFYEKPIVCVCVWGGGGGGGGGGIVQPLNCLTGTSLPKDKRDTQVSSAVECSGKIAFRLM